MVQKQEFWSSCKVNLLPFAGLAGMSQILTAVWLLASGVPPAAVAYEFIWSASDIWGLIYWRTPDMVHGRDRSVFIGAGVEPSRGDERSALGCRENIRKMKLP